MLLKVAAPEPSMAREEAVVTVLSMSRLPMVIFWPITRAAEGLRVTVMVVTVPVPAAVSEAVNVIHLAWVPRMFDVAVSVVVAEAEAIS